MPAVGVLIGGGEGAAEHKGARTHLLVVSDGREAARGAGPSQQFLGPLGKQDNEVLAI